MDIFTTVANMKIRSYIAIQTCSFIDKSEHLAAGGLHCCLATLGQCQCWPLCLDRVAFTSSPEPPLSQGAHSFFFVAWALLWGPRTVHRDQSWQRQRSGWGTCLPTCAVPSFLPLCPVPAPRPFSQTPSAWHISVPPLHAPLTPQPKALHSRASLVLL